MPAEDKSTRLVCVIMANGTNHPTKGKPRQRAIILEPVNVKADGELQSVDHLDQSTLPRIGSRDFLDFAAISGRFNTD